MHFATFILDNKEKIGVLTADRQGIIPIEEIIPENPPHTMLELIKRFDHENKERGHTSCGGMSPTNDYLALIRKATVEKNGISLDMVKITAPIPHPARGVICLGKNYREHVKEMAGAASEAEKIPAYPVYFLKMVDRAAGHNDNIPAHAGITTELDYEVELAVVIGKQGQNIPAEKAEEYIFGYTIINDITARNLQRQHAQWFRGKSLDGTCPMGPYLVHKSAVKYPPELAIKCHVNGELRQNANTRDLIYSIEHIISEFSKGITLLPGDIISTGTPGGVGMGFKPGKFLQPGDEVECYIESIGRLRNKIG
ncbi:fumarylacetoacetate hydrolase family protein [Desulfoscipio geothermicus]|uniref:2-keto-4-pentenoate hydratase/2-oxohepta-3-ene-1,7-dioic acid hydratase (Catechol pathway) n=1 Tax=Desulfoscipio geothermicus DSM 3669 TaxID=1121426 RepID=A0A1I6DJK3_9FIRM|nr:fumarylacetoacetate hydrolase family protein [Desulfoscipio geothermicus]SFR05609.1 2-keto-4-pentenoate hydratase/2-oxohepta-3-ene-1,7-dioic acid hydratase (catechol pathway) [Desulfoscipio geothermicus DSM 3669]